VCRSPTKRVTLYKGNRPRPICDDAFSRVCARPTRVIMLVKSRRTRYAVAALREPTKSPPENPHGIVMTRVYVRIPTRLRTRVDDFESHDFYAININIIIRTLGTEIGAFRVFFNDFLASVFRGRTRKREKNLLASHDRSP